MNDGQRVYPIDIFVLHHSTGPRFVDTSDLTIQDWFSDTGKARGYNNGATNPLHEHPGRPGQLTYSQAQFAGSPDSSNKYNYKLTDLIARPWTNVAWHAGNWDINTQSCGLENCGNFMDMVLEDRQLMCIADFLRPIDKELVAGGYPGGINVMLHQEIYATACPGRIKDQRNTVVDMINNPDKWNAILWPVAPPTPKPVVVVKIETKTEFTKFATVTFPDKSLALGVERVAQIGGEGQIITTYAVTYTDGKETARVVTGRSEIPSLDKIVYVGTLTKDSEQDARLSALEKAVKVIQDIIAALINVFKKG